MATASGTEPLLSVAVIDRRFPRLYVAPPGYRLLALRSGSNYPTLPTAASISAHAFSPVDCRQSR